MTRGEWNRAKPILTAALFLSAPEQKAAIESAFVEDAIRRELLELMRRTGMVLPRIGLSPAKAGTSATGGSAPGSRVFEPPPPPLLDAGQSLADGRFAVVRQLGRGGMGEVYLAHDKTLGSLVALKVLYDAELREAQHARLCSGHPHIATLHDVFEIAVTDRARTVLVMEHVAGRAASRLVEDGAVSLRDAVRWARQVAAAMAHAHDRGVLHCDLKPANILISPDEGAKVLDFGIGRATFERANPSEPLRGTVAYMAPEQLLERQFSQAGDIYSLGVTLFELVTGRLPFEGETPEVIAQILDVEPPAASHLRSDVPQELDELLARALAKQPGDRYRSARALDRALEAVEWELTTRTSPIPAPVVVPIPPPPGAGAWTYVGRAALAVAVVVCSGLLASWTFNMVIDRPAAFDSESFAGHVVLGIQSLVFPVLVMSATLGVLGALKLGLLFLLRRPFAAGLRSRGRALIESRRDDVAATVAQAVVLVGFLAVGLVFLAFGDVTNAFIARLSSADPESLSPLHPDNRDRQIIYRLVVPMLLVVLIAGWRSVKPAAIEYGGAVPGGLRAAAFSLMVLLFLLTQGPYKLTVKNELPVILLDGQRCYLLGENAGDVRVYCPGWESPRIRTVSRSTSRLSTCGFDENLFRGTPGDRCEQPAPSPGTVDTSLRSPD